MKIKVMLDEGFGARMPELAHETDAGFDLFTPKRVTIPASTGLPGAFITKVNVGSATINTGFHIEIPRGYVGLIKSKSGLMVKHGITVAGGVIDCGYTGSLRVKLFNHTDRDYTFEAGDKIAQLVLVPIITPELERVESLEETERGDGGFGSTGR